MAASLQNLIGKKLDQYTFTLEAVKVRELALAIGDLKEEYLTGEKLLPTFPTIIEYWGGGFEGWFELGVDAKKVLHGEQEYEYIGTIKVGDTLTVHTTVEDVYTKSAMNFIVLKKDFFNEKGQLVLRVRSTLIERH